MSTAHSYARQFELAADYLSEDLSKYLVSLRPKSEPPIAEPGPFDWNSCVREAFKQDNQKTSKDDLLLFGILTKKPALGMEQFYNSVLPDLHRFRKLKIERPMLSPRGGNVGNDVSNIKQGVNVKAILEGVKQNFEMQHARWAREEKADTSCWQELMNRYNQKTKDELKNDTIRISKEAMLNLCNIIETTSFDPDSMYPKTQGGVPRILLQYSPESFALRSVPQPNHEEKDYYENQVSSLSQAANRGDLHNKKLQTSRRPLKRKRSAENSTSTANEIDSKPQQDSSSPVSSDNRSLTSDISRGELRKPRAREKMEILNTVSGEPFLCIKDQCLEGLRIIQARDLTLNSEGPLHLSPGLDGVKLDEQIGSLTQSPRFVASKFTCKGNNGERPCLMKINLPQVCDYNTTPYWQQFTASEFLKNLLGDRVALIQQEGARLNWVPFQIPEHKEVVKEVMSGATISVTEMVARPILPVHSGQLLWKPPGLRILDRVESDAEELKLGDFAIDSDVISPMMASTPIGSELHPTADSHNQPSQPRIDTSKEESSTMPITPSRALCKARDSKDNNMSLSSSRALLSPSSLRLRPMSDIVKSCAILLDPVTLSNSAHAKLLGEGLKHVETVDIPKNSQHTCEGELSGAIPSHTKSSEFSTSTSLGMFLDLRGKKYKMSKTVVGGKGAELSQDPIESTPNSTQQIPKSVSLQNGPETAVPRTPLPMVITKGEKHISIPDIKPLSRDRSIVVDNSFLQSQPSLVRFLEASGGDKLTMICRELENDAQASPDLILNPSTCLVLSNVQALSQVPLPGQGNPGELSPLHRRIRILALKYEKVIVFLQILTSFDDGHQRQSNLIMANFSGFCESAAGPDALILPVWISCQTTSLMMELVNAYTWRLVNRYAFPRTQDLNKVLSSARPVYLVQDETQWERFLRQAGLNAFAAQLVLAMLPRPSLQKYDEETLWGLAKFMLMHSKERMTVFGDFLGHQAVVNINNILSQGRVASKLAPPRPWRNSIHPRNLTSFFRYLFPRTHKNLSDRLIGFRLDTVPRLKLRAQSRIYQFILKSQARRRQRRAAGSGITAFLPGKRDNKLPTIHVKDVSRQKPATSQSNEQMTSQGWNEPRAPGTRRQKVLGYIKAANELRQTYQTQLSTKLANQDYDGGIPGAFPEADIVRSGNEEMLLFPSYARKHIKIKHHSRSSGVATPGAHEAIDNPDGGDAEYWRREWEKYEDANAIVDVDVRGWIYSPQKGPLNRRNRLIVAVARRLSGIPAPDASPTPSRDSSQRPAFREKLHDSMMSHEEEAAAREAEMIARRGQREAEAASRGTYSSETASMKNYSPTGSRSSSPSRPDSIRSNDTSDMAGNDETNPRPLQQRQTWNSSPNMSREELLAANEQLMGRLRPFMTMPLANTPITIFFFNDSKSQSKSVYTDESGHFKVRAALDFIPEKVRVLASENLSATEDVFITDSNGISLISDIDDTIKHSAIASGAREIFKNTFLRELGDLTIQGVKEWYSKVASMGVQLHYVSNSPWQLYPLLRSYFSLAGLPSGSFHLKQYSGMLQGIFEPAAERKKGSLDRIMADFPERKFILVGDSGEADLEVYTDIVMEHPGRILAVFIRDVTSPDNSKVSSSSISHSPDSIEAMWADSPDRRPALPGRPKPTSSAESEEFLIDFSEEPVGDLDEKQKSPSYSNDLHQLQQPEQGSSPQVPNKPAKPSNLRSFSTSSQQASQQDVVSTGQTTAAKSKPPPPPKPRRPSSAVSSAMPDGSSRPQAPSKPVSVELPQRTGRPQFSNRTSSYNSHNSAYQDEGYVASARRQLASAYNSLPAIRPQSPTRNGSYNDGRPPSPRRGLSSYPAAAARWVTGASEGDPAAGGDGGAPGAPYDKKLEMWKRRWARAEDVMRRNGVYLRTWRVGSDVMDDCIKLIEKAQRNLERK